ncbi:hypothetical protein [Sphingobium ummariense]|uniref:DUF3618 domain-containing protein n=1 Tax=Sphingobium ummariense RL-3 TaxID=1346791 RepID=T0K2E0_9SPHN|nr:hypothetical protein [Sphingobium ummariense]EQB30704.1 hypothetical protein M529_18345 [Sphingobium ummariense RL-3]
MSGEADYKAATARAREARAHFLTSAQAARDRITPARLKQDAQAQAADVVGRMAAKARQRPIAIGTAAAALLAYLARRPLAALFGRLYVRLRNRKPESDDV